MREINNASLLVRSQIETLLRYKEEYYNKTPSVPNVIFDDLKAKVLKTLDELSEVIIPDKNELILAIGSVGANVDGGIMLYNRMRSIKNVFNPSELVKWLSTLNLSEGKLMVEYKFDGLSVTLQYRGGEVTLALTRGDGETGKDITIHVNEMDIPKTINGKLIDVQGEIILDDENFKLVNELRIADNKKPFDNPRNGASGIIARNDTRYSKYLTFKYWGVGDKCECGIDRRSSLIYDTEFALDSGFSVEPITYIDTDDMAVAYSEIMRVYLDTIEKRSTIGFPIDGLVIKVVNRDDRETLGYTSEYPRWARALKLPPEEVVTTVTGITWQSGTTGVLTPVAELTPVAISGSVVSRVTLHNLKNFKELGLRYMDSVVVIKSGDVIPKLTKVLPGFRISESKFRAPKLCGYCNGELDRTDVNLFCSNVNCDGRAVKRLLKFASKNYANFKGLAEKTVNKLFVAGKLRKFKDYYSLIVEDFKEAGVSVKVAKNILTEIEGSKGMRLNVLLGAMQYPLVGKRTWDTIINIVGPDVLNIDPESFSTIGGIGDEIINTLKTVNYDEAKELIEIVKPITLERNDSGLVGEAIVITGTHVLPRSDIIERLVSRGATIGSSVTKNTTILLFSEENGSKYKKAIKLGTKLVRVGTNEYNELIGT